MKKLYFLAAFFCVGISEVAWAQYTATNSGNWSNPVTWAPGAVPSTVCANCSITISSGIVIQLDQHVELAGSTTVTMQDGAQIIIGNSSQMTITTGYNIVMDTLPGNATIDLLTANSIINVTAGGEYDGLFVGPFPNSVYQKIVGNPPTLFVGNQASGTSPAAYGQILTGPHVLFSGGTLPLMLTNFDVAINSSVVNVNWTLAEQESSLDYFIVLRSGDGSSWEQLGKISAQSAANYSFVDPSPLHGINYYRIESVDFDGSSKLSVIDHVQGLLVKGLVFAPNPARDHINITFGSDVAPSVVVRFLSIDGKVLQQQEVIYGAGTTILLDVNNYPNGIYTVHVKGSDGSQSAYQVLVAH